MQNLFIEGFPVIGTTRDIPTLVECYDIGLLLYTINNITESEHERVLQTCRTTCTNLVILPDIIAEISAHFQSSTPISHFKAGIETPAD
jgi:FlaA1/EpsC-like NDP-sugar epimerase